MQTKNFPFVIGLAATLVVAAQICVARDTPDQIKAREALRQKMAELDASSTNTPAPVVAPAPPPAAPSPAVAPVAAPKKKAPVFPVAPAPAPAPAPVAAPAPAPAEAIPQPSEFGPVPDAVTDANTTQAREALRQEMAVLQTTPASAAKPIKSARKPAFTAPVVASPLVMDTPPSLLSGPKAVRLAELLQRYNNDQLTPKEYHSQRAAILAEP